MAKKESKRVMEQRKRACDRVSFVIEKDMKYLIRAQALREGVSSAEVMRRAILARCGLESVPDTTSADYKTIRDAVTRADAEKAITRLQISEADRYDAKDESEKEITVPAAVMLAGRDEKIRYIVSMLDILDAIEDTPEPAPRKEWQNPAPIKIRKGTLEIVRRLLSNIETVSEDDETE